MRRAVLFGWLGAGLLAILAGCGGGAGGGMTTEEWATVGAYHEEVSTTRREVGALNTQVAALFTAVPTNQPATPAVPFAQAWSVAVAGVERELRYPNPATPVADPPVVEAQGAFLAVRLAVSHAAPEPIPRFPWWSLRLDDGAGHTFTPQEEATEAFVAAAGLRRPEAYQPLLVYDEAVVFDAPAGFGADAATLRSADGTLALPLPAVPAPTAPVCQGDDCV